MFALVALLCLYRGGNNIRKAFTLAPFGRWELINWALAVTGILMLIVGVLCILQAMKDLKAKEAEIIEKEKAEKEKRQQQFFFDEEYNVSDISSGDVTEMADAGDDIER